MRLSRANIPLASEDRTHSQAIYPYPPYNLAPHFWPGFINLQHFCHSRWRNPVRLSKSGLSYRDVEELLAERGVDVSYETVRRWVLKFGPVVARRLRERRPRPSFRWHLDEMVVRIARKRMYLWRAVDHAGAIRDILVHRRPDKRGALRLMAQLLRKQGFAPRH